MRAVVVGGGVAGPAVALALAHVGIESVVLERRSDAEAAAGSYFTIAPNGLDALNLLGALDIAVEHGFPSRTNVMYGATGRRLGEIPLGRPLRGGLVAITAKRPLLAAGLRAEAERRGVTVHRDAEVTSVADRSAQGVGVAVTLADGREVTGDLVVGADGVRSLVRRTIDPQAPAGRYVGLTNFGGISRQTPVAAQLEPEAWHFVFGHHAFFGAHPTPSGDVVWFVNVPEPEIDRERRARTTHTEWSERLSSLVAPDAGPAAELVRAGELELAGDNTYDLPHVPRWTRGRLVLVGDAAHAPSPSSGQGASMALEDAVVLAKTLRDQAPSDAHIPEALRAYEESRRKRVERIVAAGARSSSSKTPGPVGRRIQEAVMPLVFRYLVTDRSTWMTGSRLDWDDPVRV